MMSGGNNHEPQTGIFFYVMSRDNNQSRLKAPRGMRPRGIQQFHWSTDAADLLSRN
jgi:hypothetical protein